MNVGASNARGDVLWFLHADTLIPDFNAFIADFSAQLRQQGSEFWGFFPIKLADARASMMQKPLLNIIAVAINARSRITSVATGDQGLFFSQSFFQRLCGFRAMPLFEDVEISKRGREQRKPVVPSRTLMTSARRWLLGGVMRTMMLMWYLRFCYWRGDPVEGLAALYRQARDDS